MEQKKLNILKCNNDLVLAINLFQKLHPYTEILGISKEKYVDFSNNDTFDVYLFKTAKKVFKITTYQIIEKLFK